MTFVYPSTCFLFSVLLTQRIIAKETVGNLFNVYALYNIGAKVSGNIKIYYSCKGKLTVVLNVRKMHTDVNKLKNVDHL